MPSLPDQSPPPPPPPSPAKGETVLITGAARRVGRIIALHLAHQGYDILLHYRHSEADALQLQAEIHQLGRQCTLAAGALEHLTQRFIPWLQQASAGMPPLRHLIHNASSITRTRFMESALADFQGNIAIHAEVPYFLSQAFAAVAQKGTITAIVDSHVKQNQTPYFPYLLSKKTLLSLMDMLAVELAPAFRCNAVLPGVVIPFENGSDTAYVQKCQQTNPLRRICTPQEVAHAIQSCIESPYMVGQHLILDAGQHLLP